MTTASHGTGAADGEALKALLEGVRGGVLRPGDAEYDPARQVWNGMIDRRPAFIARCTGAADVIDAVNFARTQGLAVSVRGGGHNVAGTALCEGGMMLDLSSMRGVRVDPQARRVRVQGGALWKDVDRETQIFGLATPSGYVSTTGVAGFTLGGGYGSLRRKYGMTCDSLVAADVVTADGKLVTTSESENPELLWALRGGGGNFGAVTSFEFACYPVGPIIFLCGAIYPLESGGDVIRGWRDFMASAPEELASNLLLWSVPSSPMMPPALHGRQVVVVASMFPGDPAEGERAVQPLRQLGEPLMDMSGPMPYVIAQSAFDPFFPPHVRRNYWKAIDLDGLGEPVIDRLLQVGASRPTGFTAIPLWHFGGAMNRVEPTATAFWRRRTSFMVSFDAIWEGAGDDQRCIGWVRDAIEKMRPFSDGGEYVNFPGLADEGDAQARAGYGGNYDRLVAIKRQYDPTNLFRFNVNIRP